MVQYRTQRTLLSFDLTSNIEKSTPISIETKQTIGKRLGGTMRASMCYSI